MKKNKKKDKKKKYKLTSSGSYTLKGDMRPIVFLDREEMLERAWKNYMVVSGDDDLIHKQAFKNIVSECIRYERDKIKNRFTSYLGLS